MDTWGRQLLTFVVFTVLTRKVPPSEFGVVAIATLYLSFIGPFTGQGLGPALVRRKDLDTGHLQAVFWVSLTLALLLMAVTVGTASGLSVMFGDPRLSPVLKVLALSLPLSAFAIVPTAILTRNMQFAVLTSRSLIATTAGGVAGIACAFAGLGVWSLIAQQMVTSGLSVSLLWAATDYRPAMEFSWSHLRDLRGIAVAIMANSIVWFACQRADQVVVGLWIGPVELALYAVALRMLTIAVDAVVAPVARVALPALAAVQQAPAEFDRTFNRLTIGVCALGIPAVVGLAVLGSDLILALSGSRWSAAGPLLPLLAGVGLVRVFFAANDGVLTAKGRPKLYVTLLALQAITSVAASALGVRWGLRGVAIAASTGMVLQGLAALWALRVKLGVRVAPSVAAAAWILGASGVMGAVVHAAATYLRQTQRPLLVAIELIAIGATIYAVLVLKVLPNSVRAELKHWRSPRTGAAGPGTTPTAAPVVPTAVVAAKETF